MAIQKYNPLLKKGFEELGSNSANSGPYIQEMTATNASAVGTDSNYALTNNTVTSFVTRITAVKLSTTEAWCAILKGGIKKLANGTSSIVDTQVLEVFSYDTATADWSAAALAHSSGVKFSLDSNGDASSIKWRLESVFNVVTL